MDGNHAHERAGCAVRGQQKHSGARHVTQAERQHSNTGRTSRTCFASRANGSCFASVTNGDAARASASANAARRAGYVRNARTSRDRVSPDSLGLRSRRGRGKLASRSRLGHRLRELSSTAHTATHEQSQQSTTTTTMQANERGRRTFSLTRAIFDFADTWSEGNCNHHNARRF
jgi:hypothetical protein